MPENVILPCLQGGRTGDASVGQSLHASQVIAQTFIM